MIFFLARDWKFGIFKTNHKSNTHEKSEDATSRWYVSRIVIANYVTFNIVKLESYKHVEMQIIRNWKNSPSFWKLFNWCGFFLRPLHE